MIFAIKLYTICWVPNKFNLTLSEIRYICVKLFGTGRIVSRNETDIATVIH